MSEHTDTERAETDAFGTDRFWDALADDRFLIRRCTDCEEAFFPPGPICPHCHSRAVSWAESSGVGTVFSFTRQHATAPMFDDELVVGLVELEDGPRVLSAFESRYEDLEIGAPVRLEAVEYDQEFDRGRREDEPFFVATLE
ncbi:hypothetical protein SAMN04487967_1427 [Natronorubrum sediminis]|uniref:DUF35 domain-containing protein n=1 Tax=Natronorubrum sediminis TaxID=640943 RepID=A0A1H6FUK2_9EURY|nr:zinc ribbon domain-containing protein [Natronorubrum sediminis]SEH13524.1 hypothetical protein SAMN04487967_1427 [Natronorubrum sediminis]